MIVNRTIYINPVEPEYLAFRFSQGIDTKVDFQFRAQNGAPWNEDVVAQLQMTARSGLTPSAYYSVPSTDIVNGRARMVIPGDLAYDPNGWQLRLTGTIDQEPRVLAYGVATAVAGAGPQVQPQDVIDHIDITLTRDSDCLMVVRMWQDEGKNAPFDLTVVTVAATTYDQQGGNALEPFTVTPIDANSVQLTMDAATVNLLPDLCWWDMTVASGGGVTTVVEGSVTVRPAPVD